MPENTTTGTPHPTPDSDQTWPMIYSIVGAMALLVISVVVFVSIRNRKRVALQNARAQSEEHARRVARRAQ